MKKIISGLFVGLSSLAVTTNAFAADDYTSSFLKSTDIGQLIAKIAGGLSIVSAIVALALVVFAIKHGVGISHESDPRARAEKIKGLGGWALGALISIGASAITGAVYAWIKSNIG